MKQADIDNLISKQDAEYVSLKDFTNVMQKEDFPSPYRSKFSLSKLIKELQYKSNASQNNPLAQTIQLLESMEEVFQNNQQSHGSEQLQQEFKAIILQLFPFLSFDGQMSFIKGPFENYRFRFQTQAFEALFSDDRWEVKIDVHKSLSPAKQNILMAGAAVLNTFYGQNVEIYTSGGMMLRDRETMMERHYNFNVQLEYMEVKALKPLKELSPKQIHELLNNLYNEQLWLEYIPPENFEFNGFIIGLISDVTRAEILSVMKELAADEGGNKNHEQDLDYIEILARSFMNMPDLHLGALQIVYANWNMDISWGLLRYHNADIIEQSLNDADSIYGRMISSGKPIIIEDLGELKYLSPLESKILEKGYRSLLLAPITNDDGKLVSIFEIASPKPYRFNQLTLLHFEAFISHFETGTNKFLSEMDKSIRLTIQQEFTSIHPSVEWKFQKVAYQYFWQQIMQGQRGKLDPIVFQDVYPLYGQADIVGSSRQRNHSIRIDLMDNLERLLDLLKNCRAAVHFHLLEVYAENVSDHLERLKEGAFISSDESVIVELLTEQIHPLLRKLRPRFPQLPQQMMEEYFDTLDPELDIVYQQRKAYEDSVSLLNQAISHYLLQEEEKMQDILPHYFEKFQTDGVEYNLYLGQAILEEGTFHSFYLQDFRLWQLIVMCGITRIVAQKAEEFPIRLTTAQLVFVFNNTLSIRFQMDTKQFDVDGAYNVRYEILKKRIDKAYIKGTDERLTQAGKIAIVWIHEKDRQEYQQYLDHLVRNGYINPEIEELELEKMQGVEGLKATRVTVIAN